MSTPPSQTAPKWTRQVLLAAAVYNLAWGAATILAPMAIFRWTGLQEPLYPQIWQCVGMIVGVYGIGYWIAAGDPFRHWPIVFVGFLGKILGPIGFVGAALSGELPWSWGLTIVTNDLIWWIPFAAVLYLAVRHHADSSASLSGISRKQAMSTIRGHQNASLIELSEDAPTLVVFLRHSGCTFCRETLSDLVEAQHEIKRLGANLAVVHMGQPMDGTLLLQKYGLDEVHHFSDPNCYLYRAFDLTRGRLRQLFGVQVLRRGLVALWRGHGLGRLAGDGFRMPGAFVIFDGEVMAAFRAEVVSDRLNYVRFVSEGISASRFRQASHRPVPPVLSVGHFGH